MKKTLLLFSIAVFLATFIGCNEGFIDTSPIDPSIGPNTGGLMPVNIRFLDIGTSPNGKFTFKPIREDLTVKIYGTEALSLASGEGIEIGRKYTVNNGKLKLLVPRSEISNDRAYRIYLTISNPDFFIEKNVSFSVPQAASMNIPFYLFRLGTGEQGINYGQNRIRLNQGPQVGNDFKITTQSSNRSINVEVELEEGTTLGQQSNIPIVGANTEVLARLAGLDRREKVVNYATKEGLFVRQAYRKLEDGRLEEIELGNFFLFPIASVMFNLEVENSGFTNNMDPPEITDVDRPYEVKIQMARQGSIENDWLDQLPSRLRVWTRDNQTGFWILENTLATVDFSGELVEITFNADHLTQFEIEGRIFQACQNQLDITVNNGSSGSRIPRTRRLEAYLPELNSYFEMKDQSDGNFTEIQVFQQASQNYRLKIPQSTENVRVSLLNGWKYDEAPSQDFIINSCDIGSAVFDIPNPEIAECEELEFQVWCLNEGSLDCQVVAQLPFDFDAPFYFETDQQVGFIQSNRIFFDRISASPGDEFIFRLRGSQQASDLIQFQVTTRIASSFSDHLFSVDGTGQSSNVASVSINRTQNGSNSTCAARTIFRIQLSSDCGDINLGQIISSNCN